MEASEIISLRMNVANVVLLLSVDVVVAVAVRTPL